MKSTTKGMSQNRMFRSFSGIIASENSNASMFTNTRYQKGKSKAKIQISPKAEYFSNLRNYLFFKLEVQIEIQI